MIDLPGKNMLFDDETVRQLYAQGDDSKGVSVSSLFPTVSKTRLNSVFTKVVTNIANDDPDIRRLARQLSDSVDGIGQVSALKLLAMCGMLMGEREKR